jgi:6-phosphogluconolactonase
MNQLNRSVKIFSSPYVLAEKFAEELITKIKESADNKKPFTIALSGGSTPELLFTVLADHYSGSVPWQAVHFFWGDERCVPADSPESNFGMTKKKLLDEIEIPLENIHRIAGENIPEEEASRYSCEISCFTGARDNFPRFDMVILGLGEDGHVASIFPDNRELIVSEKICAVAVHPVTKQKRVTITGRVINNADSVVFLVTGRKKAVMVDKILNKRASYLSFPASAIYPVHGELRWLIDGEAAGLLNINELLSEETI